MTALDSTAYLEQTRQPKLYAILITFTVLSTLAVILRFISRSIGSVGFRRDDVLILVGWAIFMCFIGIGIGISPPIPQNNPIQPTHHTI